MNAKPTIRAAAVRRAAISSITVLAISTVAACGASSEKSGSHTTGGVFTMAISAAPPTLNPASGDPAYGSVYQWAYEPLVVLNGDGSYSPGLATKWGYTDTANKVYELTLRDGAKFSDGTPVNADAVKTYLEYEKTQKSTPAQLMGSIAKITVTGPLTLRLDLNRSDPGLTFDFAQAFGAGFIASPKAVASPASLNTSSAGAGEYVIDPKQSVANDHYTYVPNPYYYDKSKIQFDKVVLRVVTNSSTVIQGLKAGTLQAAQGDATTIAAAKAAGIHVAEAPQALSGLNLMDREGKVSKPLANPIVRQALNLAVDRAAIAKGLYGDSNLALDQFALPGSVGYDQALDQQFAYDPTKAKALLAQAGYSNGFTLKVVSASLDGLDKLTEAVAGYLEKIGVKLEIDTKGTANDYFTSMVSGQTPAAALAYGLHDANSLYAGYVFAQGPFNPFHVSDPKLDALYAQYFATPTAQAGDLEKQINDELTNQGWALPVVGAPLSWYYVSGYTGIQATTNNAAVPLLTDFKHS